jgi:stage III sporulation protein AG
LENNFFKSLFNDRKKTLSFLLAAAALIILVLSLFGGQGSEKNENQSPEAMTLEEYKADLEEKIAALCSSVSGVGKCKVFITFSKGEEKIYKGGVVIETKPPAVLGVSVICRGAESEQVRYEITRMISALFNIGTNRIAVLKLNS